MMITADDIFDKAPPGKPPFHFHSRGPSGNIYAILAEVRNYFRHERRITEYNELWERVQKAKSYDEALAILREKVELIDDDGRH